MYLRPAAPLVIVLSLAVSCGDDNPTYKPDTTPPALLSGPTVSSINKGGATISWRTDDRSTSEAVISSDPALLVFAVGVANPDLVREHSILVGNENPPDVYGGDPVSPGTLIYYRVGSHNAAGMSVWSEVDTFTTLPDTTSP